MSKTELPPQSNRVHPWDQWENGEVHEIRKRTKRQAQTFRNTITKRASLIGRAVETRVHGTLVSFRFLDRREAKKGGR